MDQQVRQRWTTTEGRQRAAAVWQRLREGKGVGDLAYGLIGGRSDLRGLSSPVRAEPVDGIELGSVDLSYSNLPHLRIRDGVLVDCMFDATTLTDWRLWRTRITASSFQAADLRSSSLGAWSERGGNSFTDVVFNSANMSGVSSSAAVYTGCDFSFAALDGVNFWQSSLIRCKFAGPVRRVIFDGRLLGEGKPDANPMTDVDLSEAELYGCAFRGIDFTSVRLPHDDSLIVVRDARQLDRAVDHLSRRSVEPGAALAIEILANERRWLPTLLNLRDFPSAASLVMEALHS